MRKSRFLITLFGGIAIAATLAAPAGAADAVAAGNAWVRAPVAGQPVLGGYLELESARDAALVGVASPAAGRVEMHVMSMEGGVMRMRQVPRIELPAGKRVVLAPGGLHLMLFGPKEALAPGARVPLTLTVEGSDGVRATIAVEAEVRTGPPMQHRH